MDKGIRQEAVRVFIELMPRLAAEPELQARRGMKFRSLVHDKLQEAFDISRPSAGAAYQYAFAEAKKQFPEALVNVGRPPEKNNGGRKRKVVNYPIALISEISFPMCVLKGALQEEEQEEPTAEVPGVEVLESELLPNTGFSFSVRDTVCVKRAKDGEVIAQDVDRAEAEMLVMKAKAAKKATLVIA